MKFQKLLKKLSNFSTHPQHKMSCVIVNKNKIISVGYNQNKTHPASNHSFRMLHSEISALIGLSYEDTKGCTAYIFRERKDGFLANAKPCPSCAMALKLAGIRKVVYTLDGTWKEEKVA